MADIDQEYREAHGPAQIDPLAYEMAESHVAPNPSNAAGLSHYNSSNFSATNLALNESSNGAAQPVVYATFAMALIALFNFSRFLTPELATRVLVWANRLKSLLVRPDVTKAEADAAKKGVDGMYRGLQKEFRSDPELLKVFENVCEALKREIDYLLNHADRLRSAGSEIASKLGHRTL